MAGPLVVTRVRVVWDAAKVTAIVSGAPAVAHAKAAVLAANAAADAIGGSGSGALASDVRSFNPAGKMRALIGSSLPYARIEHFGGTIQAKNQDAFGRVLLYIRPGDIQATASSVQHRGKRYLDRATAVYQSAMPQAYKAAFPR